MIVAKSRSVHYARLFLIKTIFLNPRGSCKTQKRGCRNMGGMNTGEKTDLRSAAIMPVIGYAVIRIRCSPMVVLAHETLECTGIDSRIALADVAGVELCRHCCVMIDGNHTLAGTFGQHRLQQPAAAVQQHRGV